MVNLNLINTLIIKSPTEESVIPFGRTVRLHVENSETDITANPYTASFSSASGTYQINGLVPGVIYNLATAGMQGNTTLVTTTTGGTTALVTFQIINYNPNIPPIYIIS